MPKTMQQKVKEFHEKKGLLVNSNPTFLNEKEWDFRASLCNEESWELEQEFGGDPDDPLVVAQLCKEMADVMYVILGTFVSLGIDADAVFDIVHQSNMTKPKSINGAKVKKGKDYVPPINKIIELLEFDVPFKNGVPMYRWEDQYELEPL